MLYKLSSWSLLKKFSNDIKIGNFIHLNFFLILPYNACNISGIFMVK